MIDAHGQERVICEAPPYTSSERDARETRWHVVWLFSFERCQRLCRCQPAETTGTKRPRPDEPEDPEESAGPSNQPPQGPPGSLPDNVPLPVPSGAAQGPAIPPEGGPDQAATSALRQEPPQGQSSSNRSPQLPAPQSLPLQLRMPPNPPSIVPSIPFLMADLPPDLFPAAQVLESFRSATNGFEPLIHPLGVGMGLVSRWYTSCADRLEASLRNCEEMYRDAASMGGTRSPAFREADIDRALCQTLAPHPPAGMNPAASGVALQMKLLIAWYRRSAAYFESVKLISQRSFHQGLAQVPPTDPTL
ncbi:MAG: hypothetical protein M1833_005792 [Piccolia ochrophora]|nr:MAG: hypothetical protein M1833_005792 [Piccolia ochrophora]